MIDITDVMKRAIELTPAYTRQIASTPTTDPVTEQELFTMTAISSGMHAIVEAVNKELEE